MAKSKNQITIIIIINTFQDSEKDFFKNKHYYRQNGVKRCFLLNDKRKTKSSFIKNFELVI